MIFPLKVDPIRSSYILRMKARLDNIRERLYQKKTTGRDIFWLAKRIIWYNNYRPFKFVEIGVFKGDTAVSIIQLVQKYSVKVEYVGFDLFEDIEEFYDSHQTERALYDTDEYPYWEFKSGEHALAKVSRKVNSILDKRCFSLIKGNSNITVPMHINELCNANMIYIDGCHDYEIVSKDWQNVSKTIGLKSDVVIIFDDSTHEGVSVLRREIESSALYKVFTLNSNQFFVVHNTSRFARILSPQPIFSS
jgi:Methyltransferase domain